ncbi:hypothetical protein Bca101_027301 [Brassica carinata]
MLDPTSLFTDIYFIDMEVWVGRGEMVILERRFPTPNYQGFKRCGKTKKNSPNRTEMELQSFSSHYRSGVAWDGRWTSWSKRGRKECNLVIFTQNNLGDCS